MNLKLVAASRLSKFTGVGAPAYFSNGGAHLYKYKDDFWSKRKYGLGFNRRIGSYTWSCEVFNPPAKLHITFELSPIIDKPLPKLSWWQKVLKFFGIAKYNSK